MGLSEDRGRVRELGYNSYESELELINEVSKGDI